MTKVCGIYTALFDDIDECKKIVNLFVGINSESFEEVVSKLPKSGFTQLKQNNVETPDTISKIKEFFKNEYAAIEMSDTDAYILLNSVISVDENNPKNIKYMVPDVEINDLEVLAKYLKLAGSKKVTFQSLNVGSNTIEF